MTRSHPYHKTNVAALAANEVLAADGVLAALSACNTPHVVIALLRTYFALPSSQTKAPRKRHPAAAIKRIQKATGKVVTGVTLGDGGRITSYTFGASANTETSEAEADELLEQWKRKKNADQS